MDPVEAETFLARADHLQVATNGPDGYPHLTTLWFVLQDGRITFRSFAKSQRIINLRRDPRVTALAESGKGYGELRGVMVRGIAHLDDRAEAVIETYRGVMEKMSGQAIDLETATEMYGSHAAKNLVVRIEPLKVVSWDHSRLEGAY